MGMQVGHLELFVPDPTLAKDFYKNVLGFEIGDVQHDGAVVWMTHGNTTILLRPGTPYQAASYQDASIAMVLYCDDLDKQVADMKNRGLVFKGTDGSDRCLTFTDPFGNWFQLVNPEEQ